MNFPLTKRPRPIVGALTLLTLALFSSLAPAAADHPHNSVRLRHHGAPRLHPCEICAWSANPTDQHK
jgi:hypothetical protein